MSINLVIGKDVAHLNSLEFPTVMNALLTAEAGQNRVPILDLDLTTRSTDPDAGIDARILWPKTAREDVLKSGLNVFQFKSGKLSELQLKKEFSKPGVQKALKDGGRYILCVGHDYADKTIRNLRAKLKALCKKKKVAGNGAEIIFGAALARWISRFPAVATLPELRRGLSEFIPVKRWQQDNPQLAIPFRADKSRVDIMSQIRQFLESDSNAAVVRVEGPAGIGKTRLALEAVLDPRFADRALYVPNADHPTVLDTLQTFYTSPEISAIVVVDECEKSRQSALAHFAQNSDGRLKLICVGIADVIYETAPLVVTPLYQPKLLPAEDIEAIIREAFPAATKELVDFTVRLADGFVKLAIFIATVVVRNGPQSAMMLAKVPDIRDFFTKFIPRGTLKSLQILSVLARIGWEEELRKEAEIVASFVGLPFSDLEVETKQLRDQGVVVPRGRYLYVSPDLLAVNAAADLWDTKGSKLISLIESFPDHEPRRQLLRRLALMGEHREVKKAVQRILSRQGLFPTLEQLDDPLLSEIFRILSAAEPVTATDLLTEMITSAARSELFGFKNGRRDVIWSIESLLRWPETSLDAARALMKLALSETETFGNNATGVLVTYFHLFLSGSPVPFEERFVLVDELLAEGDEDARMLAVKLSAACLETYETRMGGEVDQISKRPFPPEWRPATYGEIWNARRLALSYLTRLSESSDAAAAAARRETLQGISALISQGQIDDAISILESTIPRGDEERRLLLEACSLALQFQELPDGHVNRIKQVQEKAFGSTFFEQLRRWVGRRPFSDFDRAGETGFAAADGRVAQLARNAIEIGLGREELDWLVSSEAENAWVFGFALGETDQTGKFLSAIVEVSPDDINGVLLAAYLSGRKLTETSRDQIIDEIAETKPSAAFAATWRTNPTHAGAMRVVRLASSGRIPPSVLRVLMYGSWLKDLSTETVVQIVELMLTLDSQHNLESALSIMDHAIRDGGITVSEFGETIWQALENCTPVRRSPTFDWQWSRVAELVAEEDPVRFARAFIGLFGSDETWLHTDSAENALRIAARVNPKGVLNEVGEAMLRKDKTGLRLQIKLQHRLGDLVPPEIMLEWARRHGRKGFLVAANLLTLKSGTPSEAARLLVREAPNSDEVLARLFSSLGEGSFVGPISGFMERQMETLKILANDREPKIRKFAKSSISVIEKQITRQKLLEQEEER